MTLPWIGLGIGALSGLLGGGGSGWQNQSVTTDPETQRFVDLYRQLVLAAQGGKPNRYTREAAEGYGRLLQNLGFGMQTGLGGLDAYYNPYEQQVVSGVQSDFDRQRGLANLGVSQYATRAGAFGGDREAVLRAMASRDINQQEASTLANLRSAGYSDAVARLLAERETALQAGSLGLGGLAGIGQGQDANRWAGLQAMTAGFMPTSTITRRSGSGSPFAQALGGALGGYGLFGGFGGGGGGSYTAAPIGFNPPPFGTSWGGGFGRW
jgi:hypothetical protein